MKVRVNIPESLEEITLGQYQKWLSIEGDEQFRTLKLIEIMCGVTLKEVSMMKLTAIGEIAQHLAAIINETPSFKNRVKLNGKDYGFIPSLDDISLGEYTDIEDNMGDWQQMHKVMAVMYRPVVNKFGQLYNIESYEGTAKYSEAMKGLPLSVVFGAVNFIYRLGTELCKATLVSMEMEMRAATSQQWGDFLNGGGGITSSTHLPTEMLQGLKKLASLTSLSLSLMPPTKKRKLILSESN